MGYRTPAQIQAFLQESMFRMDTPAQFFGDEPNAYLKPWDEAAVRVCLFAMWGYEQAAGNLAIPMVYKIINVAREDYLCDRSYFPSTPRDLRMLEQAGIPIFGIESKHQLRDFDVIGTSVSYPVLAVNFAKQLMMSDIPPTWEDRISEGRVVAGRARDPEAYPFVVVGGQGYGAPEVLANIADAVFCGEAEDEPGNPGVVAVLERVEDLKRDGRWETDRVACYEVLAREFRFLYFPRFVDVHYAYEDRESVQAAIFDDREAQPSKQVVGYSSNLPGMRLPILKRFVKDLDSVPVVDDPPLLYEDPGMGVGDLEVTRGCPAWCSFCALTYRQKPYRQRSVEFTTKFGSKLVENTGALHLAPFGPDFPMHTQKKRLIKSLLEGVSDDVDSGSMRVDDFIADPSYILLQAYGGMDAVTLGVEGNSQRMRDLVGKGAADEDIKEAVARGIQAGIKKFKLYMIAALPGETEGDIYRVLNLAKEIADIRDSLGSQARIQFSWTPMLIEGNTPFQWFAPTSANYALGDVWDELREIKITSKMGGKGQKDKVMFFQLTQRASREIGKAMVEAVCDFNQGCWGGAPHGLYDAVEDRLVAHGFLNGHADAFDERWKHDMFGWEHIDQGINVELLWVTYQQMREFLENTDAETYDLNFGDDYHGNEWIERCDSKCYGKTCGVCDAQDLGIRREYIQGAASEIAVELSRVKPVDQKSVGMRIRAKVEKDEAKRFVMNEHFRYALRRAAWRVGLPLTKRTVRFSSDSIKFKDWTCGADFVEFGLLERRSRPELEVLISRMNEELGSTIQIREWEMLPASGGSLRDDVDLSLYDMEIETDRYIAEQALARWRATPYVKMILKEQTRVGMAREEVNAKDYVPDLWLVRQGHKLHLRMLVRGAASPYVVYASLFEKRSWIEAAKFPANRIEAFADQDVSESDAFRLNCEECGREIPANLLNRPYDLQFCPRCKDEQQGLVLEEARVG